MTDLARRAHLLNGLIRRRLEVEAQLRMIGPLDKLLVVQRLKREHRYLSVRITRLEARLR